MKSKSISFLIAVALGGAAANTFAQTPAAPVTPAAPAPVSTTSVSMKLDLVSWGPDIPGLTIKNGNKNAEVTARAFTYSKAVSYSGPNVIEIYQTAGAPVEQPKDDEYAKTLNRAQKRNYVEAPPAEVEKQRKQKPGLVALVTLPSGSRRATVLLAPTSGGLFRSWVIDDDPTKFPLGKLRVHNYAPMRIAMTFNGKAAKEFKQNESVVVNPENGHAVYELAYQFEGAWKMQENNLITVPADEQVQLLILKSDEDLFVSSSGTRSGFLQTVILRRGKDAPEEKPTP